MDNSQSIMSDGCKHSSQYSVGLQPVSVLAVLLDKWFVLLDKWFVLLDKWFVLHS